MPIASSDVPEFGPPMPLSRGVRWARSAPAGYKRLQATNADGVMVVQWDILETLLDGGEVARAWAWLDAKCPETDTDPQAVPIAERPALFVMG